MREKGEREGRREDWVVGGGKREEIREEKEGGSM